MGDMEEMQTGAEELTEALGRSEERAFKSQMTRLMMHIIKWKIEPQRRSRSWVVSIENARIEIADILEYEPYLKPKIPILWEKCFKRACRVAEKETGIRPGIEELSRKEVFEDEYLLPKPDSIV